MYVCTTTSSSSCSEKQLRVPTCSISALVTVLLALGSSLPGKSHNTIPHTGGQVRMYNDVQLLMTKTCIPELITKKRMRCTAASRWSHQRPSQDYGHSKAGFTRNARQRWHWKDHKTHNVNVTCNIYVVSCKRSIKILEKSSLKTLRHLSFLYIHVRIRTYMYVYVYVYVRIYVYTYTLYVYIEWDSEWNSFYKNTSYRK